MAFKKTNIVASKNFVCSGAPNIAANKGVKAIDINTFTLYEQTAFPSGNIWTAVEQSVVPDTTFLSQGENKYSVVKEVEVDFGTEPQVSKIFEVSDLDATESSRVLPMKAIKSPSDSRNIDEVFVETLDISAKPKNKSISFYVKVLTGSVLGKFIIWYLIH